jgi:hypothetical protein
MTTNKKMQKKKKIGDVNVGKLQYNIVGPITGHLTSETVVS